MDEIIDTVNHASGQTLSQPVAGVSQGGLRWSLAGNNVLIVLILVALFCFGCASQPPAEQPAWIGKYGNACLPEAIAMAQGLREKQIWAKVLRISTPDWNHAICVYLYPPGENKLWGWDSYWMSLRLRAFTHDPDGIARAWLRSTHPFQSLNSAQFYD